MPMPDTTTALGRARVLRAGGCVKRYHTARTVRGQTVAEHSWGVAMLCAQVAPGASAALIRAALQHDISETVTGDIPAPAKWACPALADAEHEASGAFNTMMRLNEVLTDHEYDILKWCDMMELLLWCAEEARLGNTFAIDILHNGTEYLNKKNAPTNEAWDLFKQFLGYIQPLLLVERDWYA